MAAYDRYQRIQLDEARYRVQDKQVARVHRMSIGTIMGDTLLDVQYLRGRRIGQVEESFISRLKPGDKFTLAGKVLEFVRLRDMKVWVRRARGAKGIVPRWYGGKLPLSETLTAFIRKRLTEAAQERYVDAEMQALASIFAVQRRFSHVPAQNELLIERMTSREGHHLFFYPIAGRLVHEGLAALVAYRLSLRQPITFTIAASDYGFELLAPEPAALDPALAEGLLSIDNLIADIEASLNAAEMARRQFREIARVSGLVYPRYPGSHKTMKQIQVSSSLIYDVLADYDADNLLLDQARREVLSQQLEHVRLTQTMSRLMQSEVIVNDIKRATPFAFPLLIDRMRQTVSSETLEDRIQRMLRSLEKAAGA